MFPVKLILIQMLFLRQFQFQNLEKSDLKQIESCGRRPNWNSRNKHLAWPWMASIGKFNSYEWQHQCGATILNKRTLLTAGFCVDKESEYNQIIVGRYNLNVNNHGQVFLSFDKRGW